LIEVPEHLAWWREREGGGSWLDSLPRLAEECAERWSLRLGDPFSHGNISLTVPATRSDGEQVVLKLNFPEEESEHEADALEHWRCKGAVRLLEADRERNALLVERAEPGTPLWEVADDEEATLIAASVLRSLWRRSPPEGHPFHLLAAEAEKWAARIRCDWERLGRPFDGRLVDAAAGFVSELAGSQPEVVVCHQDLQGSNVLRAQREPWLAIDPKPIVGEPAFDVASLLRDRRWSIRGAVIGRRLDLLAAELGLERRRMQGWALVHALHWGIGPDKIEPDMVECARLLAA
jgi:streptomycin 6-kinase